MLRLSPQDDKDVTEFQKLHPLAKQNGFGRLFRSPTLFEDVIKSILLCNCNWTRSLQMAEALCGLQLELGTRTKSKLGNFPNPEELADFRESFLKQRCNLGYRALHIIELAMKITYEHLDLEEMLAVEEETTAFNKLMELNGFGPFVCANVLMCMGFYIRVPVDTETRRHLSDYHSIDRNVVKTSSNDVIIEDIYGKYSPFQCLAYWFELVDYYQKELGLKLSELPHSKYGSVTGTLMAKKFTSEEESTPPTKMQKKKQPRRSNKKWKFV
ncbi:N-glycosylase/DNA lyase-like [Impatiens glandulifera]|uniref:N-glycosylase/DNA lyase-like n=1 Tax=Impatiens glandulifera TaxID=253017 RepID=UPI001FB18EC6|nr:N-glycosylase/DNA lyase-like [Impatiens glandulifera]